ncbi:amidohydrolase family protein [Flavobacterium sp. C4GT6]|uniref:amidohydrolase family protein n=1 Tax=Flavobacterium sp. C4GT6 TaxID=3103818 RepID=UPI002ED3A367
MQKIILPIILLFTQLIFSQNQNYDVVLKNVNIVTLTSNEVLENQNVAIKDGKIVIIENAQKSNLTAIKIIDLKGKYIMPSLSDAHVHFPATEQEMETVLKLNLINGVTKLRSMRGDWDHYLWRQKFNSANSYYPKLYLSAPPISRGYDMTIEEIENFVRASKERELDFIKILSIKSQDLFKNFDSICKKYKMPIAGHYPRLASGNQLSEVVIFNSNYTSFEHLGGLAGESSETIKKRITLLLEKGITICPTLLWYSIGSGQFTIEECRNMPGMEFVSKTKMQEWVEDTEKYREKVGEKAYEEEVASELKSLNEKYKIIRELNEAGVPMILSPDSSSRFTIAGFSVLGEMELLKNSNLSNFEILKMPTVNFASFFGENYGAIKIGKNADFIVLDTNPLKDLKALRNVEGVYYNQHFLDKNELNRIREDILKTVQ